MPRPPKRGTSASITIQFRVTEREAELIDSSRGFLSLSDFCRESVMQRIKKMDEPIRPQPGGWTAPSETYYDILGENETPTHRHKRGALASETTIRGVTIREWHCAEPGCHEILGGKG